MILFARLALYFCKQFVHKRVAPRFPVICLYKQCGYNYRFIFATGATRYNNLIVPNRSRRSQLPLYRWPRPRLRTKGRVSNLVPEKRSVLIREVHLWKTCGSSAVLHPAVQFEPALQDELYLRKEPMVRRHLDHLGFALLCQRRFLLGLVQGWFFSSVHPVRWPRHKSECDHVSGRQTRVVSGVTACY